MTPQPIGDRALVTLLTDEEAGLWLPNGARGHAYRGMVVAVGPLCGQLDVGDEVLFPKGSATEFKHGDETLYVLQETAVLVVLSSSEVAA